MPHNIQGQVRSQRARRKLQFSIRLQKGPTQSTPWSITGIITSVFVPSRSQSYVNWLILLDKSLKHLKWDRTWKIWFEKVRRGISLQLLCHCSNPGMNRIKSLILSCYQAGNVDELVQTLKFYLILERGIMNFVRYFGESASGTVPLHSFALG